MVRKKKGISPLVAVIMLIAFTMIVAGILAGWATRFATEQRASLEKCVRANMIIKRAIYDSVANPDNSHNITLMLYNAGTVPLTDFNVMVTYDENGPPTPETWNIESTMSANSFQTYVIDEVNSSSIDYIEIRSIECQGAYDLIRGYDVVFS